MVTLLEGPAILLGLGDSPALDHVGEVAREGGIIVFDNEPTAGSAAQGAGERVEDERRATLPHNGTRLKRSAALVLINSPITDQPWLIADVAPLVAPMSVAVLTEIALESPGWEALPPKGMHHHHLYRAS